MRKNCSNCFHYKDKVCRNYGFFWKEHIAQVTKCDDWKEREE